MISYGDMRLGYTANRSLRFKAQNGDTTWYHYDLLGNLLSVKLPNGDFIEYLIDAQNRRVGKIVIIDLNLLNKKYHLFSRLPTIYYLHFRPQCGTLCKQ